MIYTFYSYKGGVGRSMAMAGVADLFAKSGLRVLAIDFDLEAPGLERYFFDGERCRSVRTQPGLLDLILDYRAALSNEAAFAQAEFKNWRRYCTPAIHAASGQGGSVDLMTAGRREPETAMRDYALAVRSFDWQNFFYNAKGDLFFDWLRRRLLDRDNGYDVVLVDSRTGVTEMGGVCAYQLADVAVLLCAANYQNLEGTRDVARDFRSESVRALRRGRPLEIVAVSARIEAQHAERAAFLGRFRDELGVEGLPMELARAGLDYEKLAIPYLPAYAVAERLAGDVQLDLSGGGGVDAFRRLADALTLLAPESSRLHGLRAAALGRLQGDDVATPDGLLADTTRGSAGYDAFVDFGADDFAIAAQIAGALESGGLRAYLDRPDQNQGQSTPATEQALEYSQALLVLFGRPAAGELRARRIARARRLQDIAIVPVLLPGSDPGALASFDLAQSQAIDLHDWPGEEAQARLRQAIEGTRHGRQRAHFPLVAPEQLRPYPGARAHAEDDAAYFFGRETEIAQAVGFLERRRVLVITGPAQVGKTSMVLAGLLPALRLATGADPARQRVQYLDLARMACDDAALRSAADAGVLVLDGTDCFDAGGSDELRRFRRETIATLLRTATPDCRVILVARGVGDDLVPDEGIDARDVSTLELAPLADDSLLRAIVAPAEKAGHLLEPGLAERLIENAGTARGRIAQIQLALARIWPDRKRGWLTNKSLDAAGGLEGINVARWREVLDGLDAGRREAAKAIFLRLTALSGRRELVGSPQAWEPLATVPLIAAQDPHALRDLLASAGMLDLYRPGPTEGGRRAPVQVALSRMRPEVYFDDGGAGLDLKYLLWRDALAPQLRLWRDGKKDALLAGAGLTEAEQWLGAHPDLLTKPELEFLQASMQARDEHQRILDTLEDEKLRAAEELALALQARQDVEHRERQSLVRYTTRLTRQRVWLLSGLALLLVVVVFAVVQRNAAVQATIAANSASVAARKAELAAQTEQRKASAELQVSTEALRSLRESRELAQASISALNDAAVEAVNADSDSARRLADERRQQALEDFTSATEVAVERCPAGRRLYIHVADKETRAWANGMVPALQRQDFIVPSVDVRAGPSASQVRYFRVSERQGAEDAVRALRAAGLAAVEAKYIEGSENSTAIRPCHYEAWFAPGAGPGGVQQAAPAVTTIRYYRASDATIAGRVAESRGFRVLRANADLAPGEPNALAFSPDMTSAQRIEVAIAFVEAGYPLRAMRTSRNVPDPQLVQMIASSTAGRDCGLLTTDDIRVGKECGSR
jgi:hypothetical protein